MKIFLALVAWTLFSCLIGCVCALIYEKVWR